jgi:hypothetical protein
MTVTWRAAALAALLGIGGGFLLGRASTGATAQERQRADSLASVSKALDRAVAVADSIRRVKDAEVSAAVRVAAGKVGPARTVTDTAIQIVLQLVPDTGAVHRAVDSVKASVLAERVTGDSLVARLAADTLAKSNDVRVAVAEREVYRSQRDAAQVQLAAALKARREPAVTLGATLGYGPTLSGGRVVWGINESNGLTVRVKLPLPRFLGG